MKLRLSVGVELLCACLMFGHAASAAQGLLIYKSEDSILRLSEYRSINQRIVPATDYITVIHLDGAEETVPKTAVLIRVDYPDTPPTIVDDATAGLLQQQLAELAKIGARHPQALPYLEPRIKGIEQELSAYRQGSRKVNGSWLTAQQFQARLEAEKQRLAQVQPRASTEPVRVTPVPVMHPQPAVSARQSPMPLTISLTNVTRPPKHSSVLMSLAILAGLAAGIRLLMKTRARGRQKVIRKLTPHLVSQSAGDLPGKSLESLDWDRFEILVGEIFRRKGYAIEISAGDGADGGIDLSLTKEGKAMAVQCKHWKVYKVGVKEIREFFGVLTAGNIDCGYFASTGVFTNDAREFAKGKPMELIDRERLEALIDEVSLPGENLLDIPSWIGRFIDGARILYPDCPCCRRPMVLREKRSGGLFWGCSQFVASGCRGKRNARTLLLGERASVGST